MALKQLKCAIQKQGASAFINTFALNIFVCCIILHVFRNSLSIAMMENLIDNITRGQDDPSIRVIIITGVGPIFSAGHNLKELVS